MRFASRRPRSLGIVAAGIDMRTVLTHSATGDQAIFARRNIYQEIGGFHEWPLFEDVDFVSRMKRVGRFAVIRLRVTVSARRHRKYGILRTVLLIYLLRVGFWAGISPFTLARCYQDPDAQLKSRGTLACVKMGGKFVLYDAAKKATYQLDDQDKAKDFAGQKIKVTGTYDTATKTIHVQSLEAAS